MEAVVVRAAKIDVSRPEGREMASGRVSARQRVTDVLGNGLGSKEY